MIRLQQRERGIYVERFDTGVWRLLNITNSVDSALKYIRTNFGIEEAERVQLPCKGKGVKGMSSKG